MSVLVVFKGSCNKAFSLDTVRKNKLKRLLIGWWGSSLFQQTLFIEFCQLIPTPFYTNHALQMGRILMHQHRESATSDQNDAYRSLSAPKPRPSSFRPLASNCMWSSWLTFLNVFIMSCLKFRRWIRSIFLSLSLTYGNVSASWESKLFTCCEITLSSCRALTSKSVSKSPRVSLLVASIVSQDCCMTVICVSKIWGESSRRETASCVIVTTVWSSVLLWCWNLTSECEFWKFLNSCSS